MRWLGLSVTDRGRGWPLRGTRQWVLQGPARAPCRTVPSVRRLRTTRVGGCRAVAPERANAIAFGQEMPASIQQLAFGRPRRRAALFAAPQETAQSRSCVGR